MNALQAQSIVRLVRHLEQTSMSGETRLSADVSYLVEEASKALGIVVAFNKTKVLDALRLLAGPS